MAPLYVQRVGWQYVLMAPLYVQRVGWQYVLMAPLYEHVACAVAWRGATVVPTARANAKDNTRTIHLVTP